MRLNVGKLARRVAIAFLIGVFTNAIVVLLLTSANRELISMMSAQPSQRSESTGVAWMYQRVDGFGITIMMGTAISEEDNAIFNAISSDYLSGTLPAWSRMRQPPIAVLIADQNGTRHDWKMLGVFEQAQGWPMRAFSCAHFESVGPRSAIETHDGIVIGARSQSILKIIAIPIRPHWIGLLVNSLVHGGLLFTLYIAFASYKCRRRRALGLCVRCGYDCRAQGRRPCPECGEEQGGKDTAKAESYCE